MKRLIWMIAVLSAALAVVAGKTDSDAHRAGAPSEHAHDEHCGEEHAASDRNPHAGHAHEEEQEHAGCSAHGDEHGHGEDEEGLSLSAEGAHHAGIEIAQAAGGVIEKHAVFPAEILLNRDRAAAVSARYPSVVRQVFVEIGDEVKRGDLLASLENLETLAVYSVAAPLSGLIVSKDVAVGESADEERVLFEVADLGSVWADISIFPRFQHAVKKGMPVEFVAHDGHTAHGSIQYISPLVSHETRTFTARCVLEGAAEDFTPGAFVRARIGIESRDAAVRVEREAVQYIESEPVVFVPSEHGFESRPVVVGDEGEGFVEIRQGLQPGERYVASGAFALKAELVTSGMDPHAGHGH